MGLFDKWKGKKETGENHLEHDLLKIIRIVSSDNAVILKSAQECVEHTIDYYNNHRNAYEDRGMSIEDETTFLQWIGCIDLLIDNKMVCECDWKESKEEFVCEISALKGISSLALQIDSKWFEAEQDIPRWCETLDEKWEKSRCVMAAFDIDSDSYVMFPCKSDDIEILSDLAERFGYRIDFAKNM